MMHLDRLSFVDAFGSRQANLPAIQEPKWYKHEIMPFKRHRPNCKMLMVVKRRRQRFRAIKRRNCRILMFKTLTGKDSSLFRDKTLYM